MRLLSQAPIRYVLLVVDDGAERTSGALRTAPITADVVTFTSSEAAAGALLSGRRFSALVADPVDPDLADLAARAGTPVIKVDSAMTPVQLAAAIGNLAQPVPRADWLPQLGPTAGWESRPGDPGATGRLVAVCGPGGTGASSIAAAMTSAFTVGRAATGTASDAAAMAFAAAVGRQSVLTPPMRVLMADFALRADQAFLHDVEEAADGLLELIDAGRYRPISVADVGRHTVTRGSLQVLPGLHRAEHWTAVSPSAFDRMLSGLLGIFALVVADVTGEFEGEIETGSFDVEERNHMARATARRADVVVVVGAPGPHGARRLAQLVDGLLDLGIDPARIQPVINRVGTRAMCEPGPRICGLPAAPIGVPSLADDAGPLLPPQMVEPVAEAVAGLLAQVAPPDHRPAPVRVVPGSLGCAAP